MICRGMEQMFGKRRWKRWISWVMLAVMLGGYADAALAADLESAQVLAGEESPGTVSEAVDSKDAEVKGQEDPDQKEPEDDPEQETADPDDGDPEQGEDAEDGDQNKDVADPDGETPADTAESKGEMNETDSDEENGTLPDGEEPVQEEESGLQPAELSAEPALTAAAPWKPYWSNPNFSNLIVFVNFSDTTHEHPEEYFGECWNADPDTTFRYFNGSVEQPRGMRQYLYNISYGQFRVENIFPQYDSVNDRITPCTLSRTGAYYQQHESEMIQEILNKLRASGQIDSSMVLNYGKNEKVLGNLTVVVPCDDGNDTKLFYGHKSGYFGSETLNGCIVRDYNVVTEEDIYFGYSCSGVIIHEFLHTLGYPDLYRAGSGLPVGTWDIMSSQSMYVQYPLAYLRSHWTNWFDIPVVTESRQQVSLYAASATTDATKDQQALILRTEESENEFFVVEYRKKGAAYEGTQLSQGYDVKIPGSGLIIYRINKTLATSRPGPPDVAYVFRPGDSRDERGDAGAGNIFEAYLSAESGRTEYGSSDFGASLADGAITYSNGQNSGILIQNVGSASGDQITFDIVFSKPPEDEYWPIIAKEDPDAGTVTSASCMGADGTLYFLLKKDNYSSGPAYLYRCTDGVFRKMGSAPSGDNYQLVEYEGALYAAYLKNLYPKLARWNGTSWEELYTAPERAIMDTLSMAVDTTGVYMAYATEYTGTNRICAVQCSGTTVTAMGSQVVSSSSYAANPSIAAENGTVAVMYREAFASDRIGIRQYDRAGKTWKDVGTGQFFGNSGIVRIHGQKLYFLKGASGIGVSDRYLYSYDLQNGGSWNQIGENAWSDVSALETDLCFDAGDPYIVYSEGTESCRTRVKRLKEGKWTDLGGSVASERVFELHAYAHNNQIYVAYRNSNNNRMYVRSHASEPERYGWKLQYTHPEGDERTLCYGTREELMEALAGMSPAAGTCVRICSDQKNQPDTIPAGLLQTCAGQGVILEYVRQEDETGLSYTWRLENLSGTQRYEDFDLTASCVTEGAVLPGEFLDRAWLQLSCAGRLPEGAVGKLTVSGNGIGGMFDGTETLRLWKKDGDQMRLLGEADYDRENGTWVSFTLEQPSAAGTPEEAVYVLSAQALYGWQTVTDETGKTQMVYVENRTGSRVTGWAMVENRNCLFDENGFLYQGPSVIGGRRYLFGTYDSGTAGVLTGYQEYGGMHYYTSGKGIIQTGWQKIGDVWHYFSEEPDTYGEEQRTSQDGFWVTLQTGPEDADVRRYYFRNNQSLVTGWQTIEKGRYCFAPEGYAITGWYRSEGSEKIFYFATDTGKMATGCTEITENGRTARYFFDNGGVRRYGWQKIGDSWHYFQPDPEAADYGMEMDAEHDGDGWYTTAAGTWYFRDGADMAKGWQIIGGRRYYFDRQGKMAEGTCKIGSSSYHFYMEGDRKGAMGTGLFTDGQETYYAGATGVLNTGWRRIGNDWRFFDHRTGAERKGIIGEDHWASVPDESGRTAFYYFINGTKIAVGWQTIDGKRYYFNKDGVRQEGFFQVGKDTFYGLEADDGERSAGEVVKGEQAIDGAVYYFGENHAMYTGWKQIAGVWRYFDTSPDPEVCGQEHETTGPVQEDAWYWYTMDGGTYCFKENRTLLKNWQAIQGADYYMDPVTGRTAVGTVKTIGDHVYCFDEQGRLQKDTVRDGYGYNEKGQRIRGWKKLNGSWHYFRTDSQNPDGWTEVAYTGIGGDGWVRLSTGELYYFRKDTLLKNWQTIDGKRYYLDAGTGALKKGDGNGFFVLSGKTYCMDEKGALRYGWISKGQGIWIYADVHGMPVTGWQTIDGTRRYFDPGNYTMKTGYFQAERIWYYFGKDGNPMTGWQTVEGRRSYFNRDGQALTGRQTIQEDGEVWAGWKPNKGDCYYFDSDGDMQTGKIELGSESYFFSMDGRMRTGFVKYCGTTFYFSENGQMATGWRTIGQDRYYFNEDGAMATGFVKIGTAVYGFGRNLSDLGKLLTGEQRIGEDTYLLDGRGMVLYGWQKPGQAWRFFDPDSGKELPAEQEDAGWWWTIRTADGRTERSCIRDGKRVLTGWQTIDGRRYYFDGNGLQWTQEKGWLVLDGKSYYFNRTDHSVYTGFLELTDQAGTHTWYLNNAGQMVTGWQTIRVKDTVGRYYFDPSGGELWTGRCRIGEDWYYLDPEQGGRMRTGSVTTDDGCCYYDALGRQQTGWQKTGGTWNYFLPESGKACQVSVGRDCWAEVTLPDGTKEKSYIQRDASVLTGWQVIDGQQYYFDSQGFQWTEAKGWLAIGQDRYYFDDQAGGSVYRGFLKKEGSEGHSGIWYVNSRGRMLRGWQTIKVNGLMGKYYFDPKDGEAWTGHRKVGNVWYYFDPEENGKMAVGTVTDSDGVTCRHSMSGACSLHR